MGDSGLVRIDVSEAIIEEVLRVLRVKFLWSEEARSNKVLPDRVIDAVKGDPTDSRILECARSAASNYVVTGDKHLLGWRASSRCRL